MYSVEELLELWFPPELEAVPVVPDVLVVPVFSGLVDEDPCD